MKHLYALILLVFCLSTFAGKRVQKKDLLGKWVWRGTIYNGGALVPIAEDTTIVVAGSGQIPKNWFIRFKRGSVQCMVCSGNYSLANEKAGTRLKLDLICKRAGRQCFISGGLIRKEKDALKIRKKREINGESVSVTYVLKRVAEK